MTHDELIEAVAKSFRLQRNPDGEPFTNLLHAYEMQTLARAAIRVIAPAVLDEAAAMMMPTNPKHDWTDYARNKARWADDIRALKTRYEQ